MLTITANIQYFSKSRIRVILTALAFVVCFAATQNISAATFTVTRNDDRNSTCNSAVDCSLREAVKAASVGFNDDTINFAAGLPVITLANEIEIVPAGLLIISGPGANVLAIDGGAGTNRIFRINNANITISGVTMRGGNGNGVANSGQGGAIYSTSGQITLNAVVVENNGGASLLGGGVYLSGGTHRITNSTFSGNTSNKCGGIYFSGTALSLVNSTISGNIATTGELGVSQGAGLCSGGATTIRNSTIANNSSTGADSQSGGISNFQNALDIGNTIIAGNSAINYPEIRNQGIVSSAGGNLIGDSAGNSADTDLAVTYQASDILDISPMLAALQNNGGAMMTQALLPGSPAIDKGVNALAVDPFNNTALAADQRGLTRVIDGNADSAATVDIGAFETQFVPTAASVTVGGRVQTAKGQGIRNVQVTLIGANGETRTTISSAFGFYRFADVVAGETYIFSVRAKQYTFSQQTQARSIFEDINDVNFVADKSKLNY
jgi:hypothetical protein